MCALAYLLSQRWEPYPASWALKGAGVATLAVMAFGKRLLALGIALALSAAGDVLLDVDPERLFVYGLGLFLLVHLTYIFLFLRGRPRPLLNGLAQTLIVVVVCFYAGSVGAWLLPGAGGLAIPVAIYMCAITVMVVSAVLGQFSKPLVVIGAVLFLISDSLLAIHKFKTAVPYRDYLVWATYYLAQYGIAMGFLGETVNRDKPDPA